MSHGYPAKITTDDSVLPTGSDAPVLFATVPLCNGKRMLQSGGVSRIVWNIKHDEDGVMRLDSSKDRGLTWTDSENTATLTGGGDVSKGEFLIEPYDDWRIVWVNGGTDQTVWVTNLSLADDRSPSS